MNSPLTIGVGAGLVSALLFISSASSPLLAVLLIYLTPLPLLIAGLGWGFPASLAGLLAGTLAAGLGMNVNVGLTYAFGLAGPAAIFVYLALLNRPGPPDAQGVPTVDWYPPGRLIAWASLMAGGIGAGAVAILSFSGGSYAEAARQLFDVTLLQALQQTGQDDVPPERIEEAAAIFARMLPGAIAGVWLAIMMGNLWLGGKITSISGRLIRPWPKLTWMEYPRFMSLGFAASLIASLAPGLVGTLASAFVGAFILAYLIMGLVVIHVLTQGSPLQIVLLVLLYVGIFLVGWIGLIVAVLGASEPVFRLREKVRNRGGPGSPPPHSASGTPPRD